MTSSGADSTLRTLLKWPTLNMASCPRACHEGIWRSRGTAPIHFGARWRRVASFTLPPLCPRRERDHGTYRMGCVWVPGPVWLLTGTISFPYRESNHDYHSRPARSLADRAIPAYKCSDILKRNTEKSDTL